MKYLIRSIKYFFYFSIICAAIITVLVIIGAVEGDINAIFEDGYNSIGKIAMFFAIVAAVYPQLGFITREVNAPETTWSDSRETIVKYMEANRYQVEQESDEVVTFRIRGGIGRLIKMCEDRITLTKTPSGWDMEGLRKDALRLASGLEQRLNATPEAE